MIPKPGGATSAEDDGSEINILDLLTQLLARKWIIIGTTLVGLLIGGTAAQLPQDVYLAQSVIHIEQRGQSLDLPAELIGTTLAGAARAGRMETEAHIIRSRLILQPVVNQLDLDWQIEPERFPYIGHLVERRNIPGLPSGFMSQYVRKGERLTLGLLEVDAPLLHKKARIEVIDETRFEVSFRENDPVIGIVGQDVQLAPGYRFRIDAIRAAPGRVFHVWRESSLRSIGRLRGGLKIRERGRSAVVDFTFSSTSPKLSQKAVNTIVETYQAQSLSRRSAEIDQSIIFLDEQLPQVRLDVAEAAEELSQFRQEHDLSELASSSQTLLERAVGLEAQLEELRFKEEDLAQRLTANHPEYKDLLLRKDRLEVRLADLQEEAADLPPLEQQLLGLSQKLERTIELERQLVNRSEQLNILKASTVGNIRILEPAEFARRIGPDRRKPLLMGGGVGLLIGALFILLRNFFHRGIDDSRRIEQLGLSLFSTINSVPELRNNRKNNEFYNIACNQPTHVVAEAFRGLRTGLQFSIATAPKRSLMITSPAPSMGKSFISLNLAHVAAQADMRVLLIDADMRKGVLRKQFNLDKKHPGLSECLTGKASIDDVLVNDPRTGLDFIPTGPYPPNPADILSSDLFKSFLDDAAKHYDLVIVDSPPVLAVTDPNIIGQHVGMSLLVVQHLKTTEAEIRNVQSMLEQSGITLSGAILNQFDSSASRYGSYGQKYGYYTGYNYKYD